MKKTKAAYLFATQILGQQPLYMWTLTFKEVLDIKGTRKRWNYLLTLIKRHWPELCGLRVFELHKMHGLHVHLVTNRFIDVNVMRTLAIQAGWGRIHVERIPAERADYLAKYLSKERPECLKGWRLWAGFGKWEWTKVKDILLDSPFSRHLPGLQRMASLDREQGFLRSGPLRRFHGNANDDERLGIRAWAGREALRRDRLGSLSHGLSRPARQKGFAFAEPFWLAWHPGKKNRGFITSGYPLGEE